MNSFAWTMLILMGISLSAISPTHAQETTWDSPPSLTQLEMDDTIVPIGKGAVFCPCMTESENEPVYGVLDEGKIIKDAKPGHRIILTPGTYTIVYGSGTKDQMMKKQVRVEEGATTIIKPDWSGLVVEVINESRTHLREYYEIYDLNTGISFGIGQGVEEGLDERTRTWILPAGTYKIVKPGDNVNAVVNFSTIRLLPGELVRTNLVIDSKTLNFIGFGRIPDFMVKSQRTRRWKVNSELAGNALLNYIPSSASGAESDVNFTSTVQWLSDGRYENGHHVIPIWSNLEEGLSMEKAGEIHKYIDKAELRLTYIYRLSDILSPYIRGSAETRLFITHYWFKDLSDYTVVDPKGTVIETVSNADHIKLGNVLSPVYLKQGFGVTSEFIKTIPANFNLRTGYGARQTYSRNSFIFNTDTKVLSPIVDVDVHGLELLLLGDIRIGRYILFNTDFDMLMPEYKKRGTWVYDGENRLRINLTSHVSLLLEMEFWKDESVDKTQYLYQTLLRFSKYF
jgi:hypothetical protein